MDRDHATQKKQIILKLSHLFMIKYFGFAFQNVCHHWTRHRIWDTRLHLKSRDEFPALFV